MSQERIQKILAQAGIASRRKAEDLISQGLVTVNGKVAKLGDKATSGKDAIKVSGKLLRGAEEPVYILFHKPKGVLSTMEDPEGRATFKDFLGKIHARIFPVGRLDFNSEGAILLTNDGALAAALTKSPDLPRVYRVKVKGFIDDEKMKRLTRGGRVGEKFVKPHLVRLAETLTSKTHVDIVLLGSAAVDLKTYFETRGFLVERIVRMAIGHLTLHGLPPGHYRLLKQSQVDALTKQPELGLRVFEQDAKKAERLVSPPPEVDEDGEIVRPTGARRNERPPGRSTGRPPKFSGDRADTGRPPKFSGDRADTGRPPKFSGDRADTGRPPKFSGDRADTGRPPKFSGERADTGRPARPPSRRPSRPSSPDRSAGPRDGRDSRRSTPRPKSPSKYSR